MVEAAFRRRLLLGKLGDWGGGCSDHGVRLGWVANIVTLYELAKGLPDRAKRLGISASPLLATGCIHQSRSVYSLPASSRAGLDDADNLVRSWSKGS